MRQLTTSPRIIINRATSDDDSDLRRLLREVTMEGHINALFTREPCYFDAAQVEGENVDVVVARDLAARRIVGLGSRAEKDCYVNGRPERIGYLSGLRCIEEYRQRTLLGRGYRFLHELHQSSDVRFYLTSIIEDNQIAKNVLTSGKAGLPTYKDFGRFHTISIRPQNTVSNDKPANLEIRKATESDTRRIADFLAHKGKQRQFFPVYNAVHFENNNEGLLKSLNYSDIYIAASKGKLVGTLGIWDQKSFKQCSIMGYSNTLKMIRPIVNLVARLGRKPILPKPGSMLTYLTLALICVENDDTEIFETLLGQALCDACMVDGLHSVMAGFHETDPFLPIAKKIPHIEYLSRIYLVFWQDGRSAVASLDKRIPYIELGAL